MANGPTDINKPQYRASFEYIRSLDGLRAVAILIVIAFHFGLSRIVPGEFGVTLFFFISGFLITCLLLAEAAEGGISIGLFYVRRFLRLAPPLFLMVIVVLRHQFFTSYTHRCSAASFLNLSPSRFVAEHPARFNMAPTWTC